MRLDPKEPIWSDPTIAPGAPGLHAFIVGVSAYENLPAPDEEPTEEQADFGLGMSQLTCAARTAFAIYEWLVRAGPSLAVPLASCRLLLAPTAREIATTPNLAALADRIPRADTEAFLKAAKAWRTDAASSAESLTFFYFAGHGVQRLRGDQVMLLEDFADGLGSRLKNAVDTRSLIDGMAVSTTMPTIARRQLYFVDACRLPADEDRRYEEQNTTAIFDPPVVDAVDDRIRPLFYTAEPGAEAYAVLDEQTLFGTALLACLAGSGTERDGARWRISDAALVRGLNHHLAKDHGGVQRFRVDGTGPPLILQYLPGRPQIGLKIEVKPDDKAPETQIVLDDEAGELPIGPPIYPHPYMTTVAAGSYVVTVSVAGRKKRRIESFDPPISELAVEA